MKIEAILSFVIQKGGWGIVPKGRVFGSADYILSIYPIEV